MSYFVKKFQMTLNNGKTIEADVCDEKARNELGDKQNKNDTGLQTVAKNIIGAINELKVAIDNISGRVTPLESKNALTLNGHPDTYFAKQSEFIVVKDKVDGLINGDEVSY